MRSRGFTLIEVLLYMGISTTILLAGATLFTYGNTARAKAMTIEEIDKQGDYVARKITQMVRNGYAVDWPLYQETGTFLAVSSYTQASDPSYVRLSSGRLTLQEGPTAAAIDLTTSDVAVSAFSATTTSSLGSPGSVRVSFTMDYNGGPQAPYKYQKTFTFSASVRQP